MVNLKTFLFLLLIILCGLIPYGLKQNKKYHKALNVFYAQSEDAQSIYTGKVRDVFDPLDEAYQVSDELKVLLKNKGEVDYNSSVWPVLSLWIDPNDLNSIERGIITHGYKKGRLWERAGYIDYYENNKKVFSSFSGIRQHGGTSRNPTKKLKSFRAYLKEKYDKSEFLPSSGLTLREGTKIKRLVIRRDTHLHFGNAISFFLINSLGGFAPNIRHVNFLLNGKHYAYHTMTEHLSTEQLKFYWGHEDFAFAKIKGDQDIKSRVLYNDLRDRFELSPNISFDYVDKQIDMNSIMASLLVIMYTGNTDWAQGIYTKDLKNNSKWKFISWDFDRAFYPVKGESTRKGMKHDYEMQSVSLGMDMKKGKIRWSVFNRLIHDDKKFRDYFSELVNHLFEDVIKSDAFKSYMNNLEKLAVSSSSKKMKSDIKKINEFFHNRKKVFCMDLKARVNLIPRTCFKEK